MTDKQPKPEGKIYKTYSKLDEPKPEQPATEEEKELCAELSKCCEMEVSGQHIPQMLYYPEKMKVLIRSHVQHEVEAAVNENDRDWIITTQKMLDLELVNRQQVVEKTMGELRARVVAANAIGCDWVLEYIDARYPNTKKVKP